MIILKENPTGFELKPTVTNYLLSLYYGGGGGD